MSVEVYDDGDDEGNNHSSSSKQQYIYNIAQTTIQYDYLLLLFINY